jgi:hypothetical protein
MVNGGFPSDAAPWFRNGGCGKQRVPRQSKIYVVDESMVFSSKSSTN